MKIYVVRKGKKPGIYASWGECEHQVKGFAGAEFKKFTSQEEAERWLNENENEKTKPTMKPIPSYAFVDGSFNEKTGVYGYGAIVVLKKGSEEILSGSFSDKNDAKSRNIAGELVGALSAVSHAIGKVNNITVYYDCEGIKKWATGEWKAKQQITKDYAEKMQHYMRLIDITFVHVKAHSGIELNERVDKIAKKAVGLK